MQWRGFEGLRTYNRTLQNDLRELERFLRELNERVGKNIASEPISTQPGGGSNADLVDHAFTHATQTASNVTGGGDPLGPWEFTWTHEHTFAPLEATRTPITIQAASGQSVDLISVQDSASAVLTVMDEQGDVAIGTDDSSAAYLTVQARAISEADVFALGPWGWWDANDPAGDTSHPANAADVTSWFDKSLNGRHWPVDPSIPTRPAKFWSATSGGAGAPAALPSSGLPVIGTVDNGAGILGFGTVTGGLVSFTTGSYTIFVVGRKVIPSGVLPFFGSQNSGNIGDICMFVGPNDTGTPDSVFIQYRTDAPGSGSQHRYSRQIGASSNNYWRFTFSRETGVAHHIWQEDTELTTVGVDNIGSPLTKNFLVQYLLKTMDNTGAETRYQYHLCEVIIFNVLLSTSQRELVWEYLDEKWQLEGAGSGTVTAKDLQHWRTSGATVGRFTLTGLGIGADLDPSTPLHVVETTEQARLGYDLTNYLSVTVGSTGSATLNLTGTTPTFTFSDPLIVNDYVQMPERASRTHVANSGSIYTKDFSGRTELTYFDSNGTVGVEVRLTNNGIINLVAANFANPTASVDLTPVNGSATTAMRSDAAPQLSQAITPNWTGAHTWTPSSSSFIPISLVANGSQAVDLFNVEDISSSDNVAINYEGILRLRDVGGLGGSYLGTVAPFGGIQDYGAGFSYGILFGLFSGASGQTELCWNNEGGVVVELTRAGAVNIDVYQDYNWQVQQTFAGGLVSSTIYVDTLHAEDASTITIQDDNLFVDSGHIRVEINNSGDVFYVGGVFGDNFADAGNVTTGETDLHSFSVIGNSLATNGDKITAYFAGTSLGSATATTQLRVKFDGNTIYDSTALAFAAAADWAITVELIRVTSNTVRTIVTGVTSNTTVAMTRCTYASTGSITFSNSMSLKVTGQRAGVGAATNDILSKMSSISFLQANV